MTNDNPESPLKPQVIDLEPEDVIVEGESAPSAPPPPATPRKSIPSSALLAIAVLGAAVVGAWIYKDILSSYLPSNDLIAAQARIDALEAQSKTLGEQLAASNPDVLWLRQKGS